MATTIDGVTNGTASIALNNLKDKLWKQRSKFADASCDIVYEFLENQP